MRPRKRAVFLPEASEKAAPDVKPFAVAKGYGVAVVARNAVEVDNIGSVYFAEMLPWQLDIYPCHSLAASDFFVS